jgi:hypothetical protein
MKTEWIENLVAWASLAVTVALYLASAIVLRRLQRANRLSRAVSTALHLVITAVATGIPIGTAVVARMIGDRYHLRLYSGDDVLTPYIVSFCAVMTGLLCAVGFVLLTYVVKDRPAESSDAQSRVGG